MTVAKTKGKRVWCVAYMAGDQLLTETISAEVFQWAGDMVIFHDGLSDTVAVFSVAAFLWAKPVSEEVSSSSP